MKTTQTLLLSLFISITAFGAKSPAKEIASQVKDFKVFRNAMFKIEARLDRQVSMDSITRMFDAAEQEFATKELSALDEFRWYSRCASLVHSGSTQMIPGKAVLKEYVARKRSFPFDLVMINKRLYVSNKKAEENKSRKKKKVLAVIPEGAEILKIEGKTIDEWMALISPYIGSDENDPVFKYTIAGNAFDFYRVLATTSNATLVPVEYKINGTVATKQVYLSYPPVELLSDRYRISSKQNKKDRKSDGKFKMAGKETAYFSFPSFYENDGFKYSQFLKKNFGKVKKRKAKTLILDLRGNSGGTIQTELLGYLIPKQQSIGTFEISKKPSRKDRKYVKKMDHEYRIQRQNIRRYKKLKKKYPQFKGEMYSHSVDTSLIFKGNIIVLTDEHTFAAASMLAGQLKQLRNAKIIGSRPGGSYSNFNAGSLSVELPSSKNVLLVNPNVVSTNLEMSNGVAIREVDMEMVPEYSPKASVYKKNRELVVTKIVETLEPLPAKK